MGRLLLEGRCLGHTRVGYRLLKGRLLSLGGVVGASVGHSRVGL